MRKQSNSKKGVWCYRGALSFEWGVRKAKLKGFTSDDCMMAGIEALESKLATTTQEQGENHSPVSDLDPTEATAYAKLAEIGFDWHRSSVFVNTHGAKKVIEIVDSITPSINNHQAYVTWHLERESDQKKEEKKSPLTDAIVRGIELLLSSGKAISGEQVLMLSKDRQAQLVPQEGEGGVVIYFDPTVILTD